ncbi:MAG: TrkA family potassium uptake protein [Clostridium sp.]|nr:TrkA family potassium uptake protein [Acetatifactor muris]MCM1526294.1 TrkA family potassium uptake protein [Bacteroides sp.]MCM1562889.1 TrkA family potassium uptake protein [Clostridium sp.]
MKSILIIGLGRFGRHMARTFLENNHEVMAIDKDEERADAAVGLIRQILIGDATDERFMESLGVDNFDLAVVAVGENFQTVLEITVLLKDLGCKFVVARATRDVHRKLLLRNGADYVSYAEREVAERLAIKFGADNIFDYLELTPEVGIYEIAVPGKWLGKSMVELSIRTEYHVSVLATRKKDQIFPLPLPSHVFEEDESVMVMGTAKDIRAIT